MNFLSPLILVFLKSSDSSSISSSGSISKILAKLFLASFQVNSGFPSTIVSAAYDVDFGTMIYQIMKKMNPASNDEFALGVSENYRKHASRCRFPLQKLKIKVFIINENDVELLF